MRNKARVGPQTVYICGTKLFFGTFDAKVPSTLIIKALEMFILKLFKLKEKCLRKILLTVLSHCKFMEEMYITKY